MRPSDSIADLLTRIRNACKAQLRYVDIPLSAVKLSIIKILKEQGFIKDYIVNNEKNHQGILRVLLKYDSQRNSVIHGLKRISKPSVRNYVGYKGIPQVLGGMGISIISTSKGVMVGHKAKAEKVGGELLCMVW